MPVILEPNSEAWNAWLDPKRTTWSKELQGALKPYEGDLECYQVPKEVGKVGNNSPDFIVPIDSKENKNNIVNFFANAKKKHEPIKGKSEEPPVKKEDTAKPVSGVKREHSDGADIEAGEDIKKQKTQNSPASSPTKPSEAGSPAKQKQMRSATHNKKQPPKKPEPKKASAGSQRITNFFSK